MRTGTLRDTQIRNSAWRVCAKSWDTFHKTAEHTAEVASQTLPKLGHQMEGPCTKLRSQRATLSEWKWRNARVTMQEEQCPALMLSGKGKRYSPWDPITTGALLGSDSKFTPTLCFKNSCREFKVAPGGFLKNDWWQQHEAIQSPRNASWNQTKQPKHAGKGSAPGEDPTRGGALEAGLRQPVSWGACAAFKSQCKIYTQGCGGSTSSAGVSAFQNLTNTQ